MPVLLQLSMHSYQFTLVCLKTYLQMYVDTGICNLFTCGGLYKTWIKDIQWFNHDILKNLDNILYSDCQKERYPFFI